MYGVIACSAGPLTRIQPGLTLEGVGALKLPLQPGQVAAIKAAAGSPAAGGAWVLGPGEFTIANSRKPSDSLQGSCHDLSPVFSTAHTPAPVLARAGWQGEVVAEAVSRAKAALGISLYSGGC